MRLGRVAIATGALVVVVVLLGAILASGWVPAISTSAGSATLATASLPTTGPGGQCLERVSNPSGWLDLCWEAYRAPDGDAGKDYYVLRVHGTVSGESGGIRWWIVRANLVGQPADGVFDAWPNGRHEGPCRDVPVALPLGIDSAEETLCGRTTGEPTHDMWGHSVTWACVGCLLPERSARAVVLYEMAAVGDGATPSWTIGADFGS